MRRHYNTPQSLLRTLVEGIVLMAFFYAVMVLVVVLTTAMTV